MKDDQSPVAALAAPPPMAPVAPIAAARLQAMLLDPDVPEAMLRPYLMADDTACAAFAPVVRVNPHHLQETLNEGALALTSLNGLARWRRRRRYRRRIRGWDGPRIVSEGDSWFQYPLLLTDVIDHLMEDHAILSLGAAGDLLTDMLRQDELLGAVASERADVVLLSAGGNDLLGASGLTRVLEPFDPAREAEGYLGPTFERCLASTLAGYRRVVEAVTAMHPRVRVVAHGYDRARPRAGRWLGRPMAAIGIEDPALQGAIVGALVDRFQDGLVALSRSRGLEGRLHVVDARGAVGARWHDELHPDDAGYADVAALVRAAIRDALREAEGARPEAAAGPLPTQMLGVTASEAVAHAATALAAAHGEAALVREAGRRVALAGTRTVLPTGLDLEAVPASSVEGVGDALMALGARVLDRAEREARGLLCGTEAEEAADRSALREALGLGGEALAARLALLLTGGALGLPAFAASVVAAVLLKRLGGAAWEEVCDAWGERLGTAPGAAGDPGAVEGVPGAPDGPRGLPPLPAVRRSRVSDVATRALNGSGRILDALTPAAPMGEAALARVPALDRASRREGVERLRETLLTRAEAMGSRAVIGREAIERVAGHAERGLGKIAAQGARADLTIEEGLATEAVILADPRLRPVLYVQDDRVTRDGEDVGEWAPRLDHFAEAIAGAVRSVGRIEAPWLGHGYAGTGFAIAPGLILTNRHVLEAIAVEETPGAWRFGPGVGVDFAAERDRDRAARFAVTGVAHAPSDPILGTIDFAHLDLAVLRCEAEPADGGGVFPEPLVLEEDGAAYDRGRELYVVGYPARPLTDFGAAAGEAPAAAHEFQAVQRTLFDGTFGVKRWSAGRLMDPPGTLPGDEADWVVNHDATTLGGSSGSCVVDFAADGARVMGLHFGGRSRAENWAHALAALRGTLEAQGARFAREPEGA